MGLELGGARFSGEISHLELRRWILRFGSSLKREDFF